MLTQAVLAKVHSQQEDAGLEEGEVQVWVLHLVLGPTRAHRCGHLSGYAGKDHVQVKISAIYWHLLPAGSCCGSYQAATLTLATKRCRCVADKGANAQRGEVVRTW